LCEGRETGGGGSRRKEKGFLGLGFFFVFFFKCAKLPPPFCVLKATIYRQKILLGLKLDLSTFFFFINFDFSYFFVFVENEQYQRRLNEEN
jgi:hypothetical protein